jgi:hypothetical protein
MIFFPLIVGSRDSSFVHNSMPKIGGVTTERKSLGVSRIAQRKEG